MSRIRQLLICVVPILLLAVLSLVFVEATRFRETTRKGPLDEEFVRISTGGSNVVTNGAAIKSSGFYQTQPNFGVLIGIAWCARIGELENSEAPFTCVIMGDDLLECEFVSRCGIDTDDSLYVLTTLGNSVSSLKIKYSLHVVDKDIEEELTINDNIIDIEQSRVLRIRLDELNDVVNVEQRDMKPFSFKDSSNRWISNEDVIVAKIKRWLEDEAKSAAIDQSQKTFTE